MRGSSPAPDPDWPWQLAKVLALTIGMVAAALLIWRLGHVLLLFFGAVLIAVLLRAAAALIERYTPIAGRWSVGLACLLIGAVLAGFVYLMGAQIRMQATVLIENLPDMAETAEEWLGLEGLGDWLRQRASEFVEDGNIAASVAGYTAWIADVAVHALIVIASGVYLALHPRLYRAGILKLVPEPRREEARDTVKAVGRALKLWLLGQLAAMVLVGVLTTLGLWFIGVPSPIALGVLAGAFEFVPIVGPLASAIPAIALGLAQSPSTALWVLGLYVLIQQIEGNLITPLIQQHAVDLPPVLTIFAIITFGVLFGPLGVLLATPLAVVCFVLIKKLWVREVLDEETELPGEEAEGTEVRHRSAREGRKEVGPREPSRASLGAKAD